MGITYHNIPMYGYVDKFIHSKREGFGWDNLGKRTPRFIALHRMVGTLRGTDSYFRNPNISSYTDFGLAIKASDPPIPGYIYQWNNPKGYRSGWASGPVSAPYGDGAKIVQKYGINAVNRDGVSLEGGGTNETYDAFSWNEMVHFCAWWIDDMEIPYTSLPLNPHTGANALIWHEEFTIGTGKRCPFAWLKANTNRLYEDIQAFLEPYQTGRSEAEVKPPVAGHSKDPVKPPAKEEKPTYARPRPIKELALMGKDDKDTAASLKLVNGVDFIWVHDTVEAKKDTPRLQFAYQGAKETGPMINKGLKFDVLWQFKADDGRWYYMTPYWTRVNAEDTKRIRD